MHLKLGGRSHLSPEKTCGRLKISHISRNRHTPAVIEDMKTRTRGEHELNDQKEFRQIGLNLKGHRCAITNPLIGYEGCDLPWGAVVAEKVINASLIHFVLFLHSFDVFPHFRCFIR